MSWEALVSSTGESEISRISRVCREYERHNADLKGQIENEKNAAESAIQNLAEQVKINNQLRRQLGSLQNSVKFEKVASDGLSKRSVSLDVQLTAAKEEIKVLSDENKVFRQKMKEYESALNNERTKRLQEMHEVENLRRKNAHLEAVNNVTQEESVKAHDALLKKLQKLETLAAANERLQDTVDAQAKELIAMTKDLFEAKQKHRALTESLVLVEASLSEKTKERDTHEAEVWRLRKELLSLASTPGEKSLAGYSRAATSRATTAQTNFSRPATTKGLGAATHSIFNGNSNGGPPSMSFSPDFWGDDDNSHALHRTSTSSSSSREHLPVVSPIASSNRPYTSAANTFTGSSQGRGFPRSSSAPSFSATGSGYGTSHSLVLTVATEDGFVDNSAIVEKRELSSAGKTRNLKGLCQSPIADKGKSSFVGSGLGLKKENVKIGHGGSAKSVLMKIMADFNANN